MAENCIENNNPVIDRSESIDNKDIILNNLSSKCRESLIKEKAKNERVTLISDIKIKEVYLEDLKNTPLFMD
jgi:hypothetical protein